MCITHERAYALQDFLAMARGTLSLKSNRCPPLPDSTQMASDKVSEWRPSVHAFVCNAFLPTVRDMRARTY